jgi:hypothetical protein
MIVLNPSEQQLLRHLVAAVNANDLEAFEDQVGMGRAYFDDATVVRLLNEHLPLALAVNQIPTLLQMLTGDNYAAAVRDFVTELAEVLMKNGHQIGTDFSSFDVDGFPLLVLSQRAADWALEFYPPHALRQAAPWVAVGEARHPLIEE